MRDRIVLLCSAFALSMLTACANQQTSPEAEAALFSLDSVKERAQLAYQYGNESEALFRFDEVLKVSPNDTEALLGKGEVYLSLNEPDNAMVYFKRVSELDPSNQPANEGNALALLMKGNVPDAELILKNLVVNNPGMWRSFNALGVISDIKGEYVKSAGYYEHAIKLQPERVSIYNNLGYSYIMSHQYIDAERVLQNARLLDSTNVRVTNNLALAIAWQGKYEDAVSLLQDIMKPEYSYNNVGYVAYLKGDYEEAVNLFTVAIDKSPVFYVKADKNRELARKRLNGK